MALFAQGLTSCGSDEGGAACEPNVLRACAGPGSCEGTQTCASDGSGYSECSCGGGNAGSAGAGGGGSAGSGSGGGAAGAGGNASLNPLFDLGERAVGAPCVVDADCPVTADGEAPLICISATSSEEFGTGGPQGGYCTAACEDTDACQAIDGLTVCGLYDDAAGSGYCVGLCQPGAGNGLVKCGASRAQSCFAFPDDPTVGACFPVCQSDAACGEGLFCDLGATGLGLCVATPPAGGDVGAACTPATAATDCKSGACVTLIDPDTGEDAGSFCSANCTFGLAQGCGFEEVSSVPRDAICIRPQLDDGGGGDIGFCFELCDEDADCAQAANGWVCTSLSEDGQQFTGRFGECVPPALADGPGVVVDAGN